MKLDWKGEDGLKFTASVPGGVLNVARILVGSLRYEWWGWYEWYEWRGWSNRADVWAATHLTKVAADSPEECMAEMERRYFSWLLEEATR